MSRKQICWLGCIALSISTFALGCGSSSQPPPVEAVFVCTESFEVFRIPSQPSPAVNPNTGQATLVQGLYCGQCQKWYPAPPLEAVGGNAGAITCPVHRSPLSSVGPSGPQAVPETED